MKLKRAKHTAVLRQTESDTLSADHANADTKGRIGSERKEKQAGG